MGAAAPGSPGEPLAVDRAVFQEAVPALRVATLAVSAVVLGDWVGAGACPSLCPVVTSGAALAKLCPHRPTAINCRVE